LRFAQLKNSPHLAFHRERFTHGSSIVVKFCALQFVSQVQDRAVLTLAIFTSDRDVGHAADRFDRRDQELRGQP
jgi:hypothetical protein